MDTALAQVCLNSPPDHRKLSVGLSHPSFVARPRRSVASRLLSRERSVVPCAREDHDGRRSRSLPRNDARRVRT